MINNKKITVVLPCRNEEDAIKVVMRDMPREIDEVIVVDNLSTDQTVKTAQLFGAKVILENRKDQGIGYGYALATGINEAGGEIVACLDGDGSYPVKKVPQIIRYLLKHDVDFISCNRLPVKDPKKRSRTRALGVWMLNLFTRLLYGYKIKDSLSGMWVFKKSATNFMKLYEGGWNFSEEIKLEAITNPNIKFTEYDIAYHDRIFNQSKLNIFQAGFNYWLFLFKFKLLSSKYAILENKKLCLLINRNLSQVFG